MPASDDPHRVTSLDQLARLYAAPAAPSVLKEVDRLTPAYRRMIEASPFLVIASAGPDGLDCSPRGDAPGFVGIEDDRTLLLPDRRGNNRIDTLRNLLADPRVALLFLIPGHGETLRVNGRAEITTAPELLQRFAVGGAVPRSVLRIRIERVYFQCARAMLRSGLWHGATAAHPLPTAGDMLRDCQSSFDAAAYDAALPERQKQTLY